MSLVSPARLLTSMGTTRVKCINRKLFRLRRVTLSLRYSARAPIKFARAGIILTPYRLPCHLVGRTNNIISIAIYYRYNETREYFTL